jgi:hypothetical protein
MVDLGRATGHILRKCKVKYLSRRIARLERSHCPTPAADLRKPIVDSVMASLSASELTSWRHALLALRQGEPLSVEQIAAIEMRNRAMESACIRAGYKSLADFNAKCPATPIVALASSRQ